MLAWGIFGELDMAKLAALILAAVLAVGLVTDASAASRPRTATQFYERGNDRFSRNLDAAIADYTSAVKLDPTLANAWYNRGNAYAAQGRHAEAIADYSKVVALNPGYIDAYFNRGNSYSAEGDLDHAIADYTEVIRQATTYAFAYFNRGNAYFSRGDLREAIADYDAIIRLKPDYADAYFNRGNAWSNLHDYDRAIADYDEVLRLQPDYAAAYQNRGNAWRSRGDLTRAVADLRTATERDPSSEARVALREAEAARDSSGAAAVAALEPPASQAPVAAPGGERRVALVIGNAAYSSAGRLPNPAADAALIGKALEAAGFTDVTVADDLGRDAFLAALRAFAQKADAADWAVVYFAGHGIEVGGVNYLVPTDATLLSDRNVPDEAVTLDRVLSAVEGARKLRLVILDACRNNPFAATMQRTSASRSVGRGLALAEPSQATLVAYAAKAGSIAADGDGTNSPFAVSLARRLAEPGVEINKVFRLVRSDVLAATDNGQEPFVYGSLPPEDFYFVAEQQR